MKKFFKRYLTILISAAVVFFSLPLTGVADSSVIPCESNLVNISSLYDEAEKVLVKGIEEMQEEIDISECNITPGEIEAFFNVVISRNPRLFYVASGTSNCFKYTYMGDTVYSIKPQYLYSEADTQKMLAEFDAAVEEYIGGVDPNWSDAEKALYLHDEMIVKIQYDLSLTKATAYDSLVGKEGRPAVCRGYALGYAYLLRKVGVYSAVVYSEANKHEWNIVRLNGKYYYVDVTWDDPSLTYDYTCKHDNFLKTESEMIALGHKTGTGFDWTADGISVKGLSATEKFPNAFWSGSRSKVVWYDSSWYTATPDTSAKEKINVNRVNYNSSKGTFTSSVIKVLNEPWYEWGNRKNYVVPSPVTLTLYRDKLLYNTPTTIGYINLTPTTIVDTNLENFYDSGTVYFLNSAEKKLGYIYGISVTGDYVAYDLRTAADKKKSSGKQKILHYYKVLSKTQPNCESSGQISYKCSDSKCAETATEILPPLGHVKGIEPPRAATCEFKGWSNYIEYCIFCGKEFTPRQETSHKTQTRIYPATVTQDGRIDRVCLTCGGKRLSRTVIYKASSAALTTSNYTYDGKVKTPGVVIKTSKGKVLKNGTDYTVSYASGRKYVGRYAVKVTFKGNYRGTKTLYFNINPKGTTLRSLSAGRRSFSARINKQTSQTTGYQIKYSLYSNFKNPKYVTVKNTVTSKTVSSLYSKRKYYVQVRTYKRITYAGKTVNLYSGWSSAKKVTTK